MGKFIFGLAVAATAALTSLPTMAETYSAKTGMAIGSDLVLETKGSAHGPLLSVDIHVASQKELIFDVSLECGLYTRTLAKSKGGKQDTQTAEASVRINVIVTDADGTKMFAYPGGEGEGVVFCSRTQTLSATFQGIFADDTGDTCLYTDPDTGAIKLDMDCLTDEEVELILDTMSANAFNFVAPDLTSGTYHVEVWSDIDTSDDTNQVEARALIGRGSMVVDEVRFVK